MVIAFDVDEKALARRLHISEKECCRLLAEDDFLVVQRRRNPEIIHRIHQETLTDINNKENFDRDWRHKSEQSFAQIINILTNMTDQEKQLQSEVDELKKNEDTLVSLFDSTLSVANATIAAHEATIADLQAKLAAGAPPEDLSQIITDAQGVIDNQKAEIAKLTPQPVDTSTPASTDAAVG